MYPLYVEHDREMKIGVCLKARIGELVDETHVRSRTGSKLALRPGFHSTLIPFTDWIGKKGKDGRLYQRRDTVWCECDVNGKEQKVTARNGLRKLPSDWYFYRTNSRQKDPWIISNKIRINRILTHAEVEKICQEHGVEAQKTETTATRESDGCSVTPY